MTTWRNMIGQSLISDSMEFQTESISRAHRSNFLRNLEQTMEYSMIYKKCFFHSFVNLALMEQKFEKKSNIKVYHVIQRPRGTGWAQTTI